MKSRVPPGAENIHLVGVFFIFSRKYRGMIYFTRANLELLFWPLALLALFFMPVQNHFSLCPLNALGFSWCPGCGIGHSIHYYLHLEFSRGWNEHYLGAFAVLIILYRIFQLLILRLQRKSPTHGQQNF